MNLHFFVAAKSDTGRRPANEDYFTIDETNKVYVVADGTASRGGGHVAAKIACTEVRAVLGEKVEELESGDSSIIAETLKAAVVTANEKILERQATNPDLHRMATTICVCVQRGNDLHMVYVGDSRIYLYRSGELMRLTRDHSLENYLKDHPEVRPTVQRPGKTLLSALGLKRSQLRIDYLHQTLERDDLILLCSDGLTDGLPDWILREILAGAYISTIDETVSNLVRASLSHGGMDNITVLLLHASEAPSQGDGHTVIFEADAVPESLAPAHRVLGWLTFADGPRKGEVIPLDQRMTFGASSSCSVTIKGDDFVSSHHAEVYLTEYGFEFRDLKSTNGIKLNKVRIQKEAIIDGDTLEIGVTPLIFKSFRF